MTSMKTCAAAAALMAAVTATPLPAHDYMAGSLTLAHPWTRQTPPGAKVGGGYLAISNAGTTPDRLLGGTTPAAGRLEIHHMKLEGDVMRMRQAGEGLPIPPRGRVELKPGGYHIMLVGLKAPLVQGAMVPATLRFAKAGDVKVMFKVEPLGAAAPGAEGHSHGTH